jgi:tripartite-type tricarboxylate transporter receptor subunit TctC
MAEGLRKRLPIAQGAAGFMAEGYGMPGVARAGVGLLFTLWVTALAAQDYPSRPIRMIVPYPAGGITDILPRIMGEFLNRRWGQPIVVDNRPGAAGNIGAEVAFKSDPDGYTMMVSAPSPFTVNQSLYQRLPFEPSEFVPVSLLATIPTGMIIGPKVPAKTLAEFIAYARANPGKISVATQGKGTTSHLTSEWFQIAAGVKFVTVPYRGSAPGLQGMLAGDVDLMFDNLGVSLELVKAGQLKLLAVATDKRLSELPDVPAIAEALPGFVSSTWVGAFLPPKTPQAIADKLSADLADGLKQPDIARKFLEHFCEPVGGTPQATADYVRKESALWKKVIAEIGIKPE